jgi:hypothetical protein
MQLVFYRKVGIIKYSITKKEDNEKEDEQKSRRASDGDLNLVYAFPGTSMFALMVVTHQQTNQQYEEIHNEAGVVISKKIILNNPSYDYTDCP